MGHRSGSQDDVMIIDYVTRKDIRKAGGPKVRNREAASSFGREQARVRGALAAVAFMAIPAVASSPGY
jgi:hypothetical protein